MLLLLFLAFLLIQLLFTQVCPEWAAWGQWMECSATCGGGIRGRLRECANASLSDHLYCEGEPNEYAECNNQVRDVAE